MKALRLPVYCILILAAMLISVPACYAGFDLSKLDSRIDLTLNDSSMADAVYAVSRASGVDIAAPAEPRDGLTASLKQETLREVLNTLAKVTGLSWHIENGVVLFKKRASIPPPKPETEKSITPSQGMTSLLASLDDGQLFYVSRGVPLPYSALTPAQQEIVKSMLAPPNAAVTESGEQASALPRPEEVIIAFRVMPLLVVPKTTGGPGWKLRLDSAPYAVLAGRGR